MKINFIRKINILLVGVMLIPLAVLFGSFSLPQISEAKSSVVKCPIGDKELRKSTKAQLARAKSAKNKADKINQAVALATDNGKKATKYGSKAAGAAAYARTSEKANKADADLRAIEGREAARSAEPGDMEGAARAECADKANNSPEGQGEVKSKKCQDAVKAKEAEQGFCSSGSVRVCAGTAKVQQGSGSCKRKSDGVVRGAVSCKVIKGGGCDVTCVCKEYGDDPSAILIDVCPNINGFQSAVPAGMIIDGNGWCVPPYALGGGGITAGGDASYNILPPEPIVEGIPGGDNLIGGGAGGGASPWCVPI